MDVTWNRFHDIMHNITKSVIRCVAVELDSMENKPKTVASLQRYLTYCRWKRVVSVADPIEIITVLQQKFDKQLVSVLETIDTTTDLLVLERILWKEQQLISKVSNSVFIEDCPDTIKREFQKREEEFDCVDNENKSQILKNMKSLLFTHVNGAKKSMPNTGSDTISVVIEKAIKQMLQSNYIELVSTVREEETVKYNMPSGFMLLCLKQILFEYEKDFTGPMSPFGKKRETISNRIANKNHDIESLRSHLPDVENQLRHAIISEAIASFCKEKEDTCNDNWQVSGSHFNLLRQNQYRRNFLDDALSNLTRGRVPCRSPARSRSASYDRIRRRRSYSPRSFSTASDSSLDSSPLRKRIRRRSDLSGSSRNRSRSASHDNEGGTKQASHTSQERRQSRTPPRRQRSQSRSPKTNGWTRSRSYSRSRSRSLRKRARERGRTVSRSRSHSRSRSYDHFSKRRRSPSPYRRRNRYNANSMSGSSRSRSRSLSPRLSRKRTRSKRNSDQTGYNEEVRKRREQEDKLYEESVLIGELLGLGLCDDSEQQKTMKSICKIMQNLSVDSISPLPTDFDVETVALVLALEKMGESKPKTMKSLRKALFPLCRFIYFRNPRSVKVLEIKKTDKKQPKVRGRQRSHTNKGCTGDSENKTMVVMSKTRKTTQIGVNVRDMLMKTVSSEIVFADIPSNHVAVGKSARGGRGSVRGVARRSQRKAKRQIQGQKKPPRENVETKTISLVPDLYKRLAHESKMLCRKWNTSVIMTYETQTMKVANKVHSWLENLRHNNSDNTELQSSNETSKAVEDNKQPGSNEKQSMQVDSPDDHTVKDALPVFASHAALFNDFIQKCIEVKELTTEELLVNLMHQDFVIVNKDGTVTYTQKLKEASREFPKDNAEREKKVYQQISTLYSKRKDLDLPK